MANLAGYDGPVNDEIKEALKALNTAQDVYARSVANIESKLHSLEARGVAADQVALVRAMFTEAAALDLGNESVRPRFAADSAVPDVTTKRRSARSVA